MHQKVSLLFSLIEFESFGNSYQSHIIELADELGKQLALLGMDVVEAEKGVYSKTHQVFIRTTKEQMDRIFNNSIKYGITLNKKDKKLFRGCGIRLGTQEIARYNWPLESMKAVAEIVKLVSEESINDRRVRELLNTLPSKEIQFTFDDTVKAYFNKFI